MLASARKCLAFITHTQKKIERETEMTKEKSEKSNVISKQHMYIHILSMKMH